MSNEELNPALRQTDVSSRLYYFDQNRRIYEMNGERKISPYHEGYFIPIKVVSETDKEIICEYGTIKKKTMEYHFGRSKYKVYTEQQKKDDVYVQENRHIISEKVRTLSAEKLRMVEAVLNDCSIPDVSNNEMSVCPIDAKTHNSDIYFFHRCTVCGSRKERAN